MCNHNNQSYVGTMPGENDYFDLELFNCKECGTTLAKKTPRKHVAADEHEATYNRGKACARLVRFLEDMGLDKSFRSAAARIARDGLRVAHRNGHPRLFARAYRMWR